MLQTTLYFLLAAITLLVITLEKAYNQIPPKELKRRVQAGDEIAKLLFKAAGYGPSLKILLWFITGLSAAGFFVVLSLSLPSWVALLGSIALVWLGFAWIPYTRVSGIGLWLARIFTPSLAWLLRTFYRPLSWFARVTGKWRLSFHTGLYEKEDLVELLDYQKNQPDNRISKTEIDVVKGALTFGDKLIRDIMTPRRVAVMVASNDTIGPLLMDELHDSGHSRFPVYEGKNKEHIIGTLYLRDLLNTKSGGQVRDLMSKDVFFMHEEESLDNSLQAFLKTRHHLFVVVNSFEEVVGVVSFEDVLEQVIGQPIIDEFDHYDDMRAVARKKATEEHREHEEEVLE